MDQTTMRQREMKCIQEQAPFCQANCPIRVDARGMMRALRDGNFNAAFTVFSKSAPFPAIISRVCDQPCQSGCKRKEAGGAIEIRLLEQAAQTYGTHAARKVKALPKKNRRVAVIGAGLSGLTAAFDLAIKGYTVVIYEAGDLPGGRLLTFDEAILPRSLLLAEIKIMEEYGIVIHYRSQVGGSGPAWSSLYDAFDAIYIGIGPASPGGDSLGLTLTATGHVQVRDRSLATSNSKVFAGGGQRWPGQRYSPVRSVADGRSAAISIDRWLQGASLHAGRESEWSSDTKLYTDITGIAAQAAVIPEDVCGYSREEAEREAKRCFLCECLECVKRCEYLAHYGSYPKRYVREIHNNDSIVMGLRHANQMVNSCSLCGLCEAVCPGQLNMGEVCLEARRSLVDKGKMPPSAHDFALRDMEFSHSDAFALVRNQPGFPASTYLFFPGCQLSASAPGHVEQVYAYLREQLAGGTGLMLGCCGAPAHWAGRQDLFQDALDDFTRQWRKVGSPCVITACSTCYRMVKDNLPEVPVESLWTVMERIGGPYGLQTGKKQGPITVLDPCTTRYDTDIHASVRTLLANKGFKLKEHVLNKELAGCCGYGGLTVFANPEVAAKIARRRVSEGEEDFVAYCAMCRDIYAAHGKRTFHILDLLFGSDRQADPARKGPGYSERHENRARLKKKLLTGVWGENVPEPLSKVTIVIPEAVLQVMEQRMILAEDVRTVIEHAERTGQKLCDAGTGRFVAHYQPVSVTYWVEYAVSGQGVTVCNAYSHRMEIVEDVKP